MKRRNIGVQSDNCGDTGLIVHSTIFFRTSFCRTPKHPFSLVRLNYRSYRNAFLINIFAFDIPVFVSNTGAATFMISFHFLEV